MNHSVSIGNRLREERQRLDLNQTQFGELGGVTKKTQMLYESDERRPDADYLAAIAAPGADVRYIITGDRKGPIPEALSADERYLLNRYRSSPAPLKDAALRVLLGGDPPKNSSRYSQQINAPVNGMVAGRDILNKRKKKDGPGN